MEYGVGDAGRDEVSADRGRTVMGWVCPLCGASNSPQLLQCLCVAVPQTEVAVPQTTATSASNGASSAASTAASTDVAGKVLGLSTQTKTKRQRKKNDYSNPDFQRFWEVYPLRKEKAAAYRAFMRYVVDAGVDVDAVVVAAAAYRDDAARDPDYTKYPQGWLSGGRWEDEAEADKPPTRTVQETDWDAYRAEEDARVEAWRAEGES